MINPFNMYFIKLLFVFNNNLIAPINNNAACFFFTSWLGNRAFRDSSSF